MIKFLYNKNKTLFKISLVLYAIAVIMGVLYVVDAVQREERNKNSILIEQSTYNGEIPAYNVEGLTEEEINYYLEQQRKLRESKE